MSAKVNPLDAALPYLGQFDAGLYVVATPIGNLGDITLRALAVLAAADAILCEDTRHTRMLLTHFGIKKPLVAFHEHNESETLPGLLAELRAGRKLALVSDAGTPLISDPGFKLVRGAVAAGVRVIPIPGASSVMAALSAAGLPTDRFTFAGFPPARARARDEWLAGLAALPGTLVLFESPHRIGDTLEAVARVLGGRTVAVGRELTKRFEEMAVLPAAEAAARFSDMKEVKGEVVLLIAPGEAAAADPADVGAWLSAALAGGMPLKAAAAEASARFGLSRNEAYDMALALRNHAG